MVPFFKKKDFFSTEQKERIVTAIRSMEQQTSGEIRVFVENKNPLLDPVERAQQVFNKLKMENTQHRNAVLLYIAVKHKELALFGDEGIYKATGNGYWNEAVSKMITRFKGHDLTEGIVHCIHQLGQTLKEKFPYNSKDDKDELPGDIIFGE